MSTVIEELEFQDNSFRTRWAKDLKSLKDLESWYYQVQSNIGSNRSTTVESDMRGIGLYDTFAITVKTTKKAISDKRYIEPLNTPPVGWCVMGMTVDRKQSLIVVQYVRESDYLTSEKEVVEQYCRWAVGKLVIEVKEHWENSIKDIDTLMHSLSTEMQQTPTGSNNYSFNRSVESFESMLNTRKACGSILYYLNDINLSADDLDIHDLSRSVYKAMQNLAQPQNQNGGGRLRFSYLVDQWLNPYSTNQLAFNWQEGMNFPQSVWSDMTYTFVQNP